MRLDDEILWVVLPARNEEEIIASVINEWLQFLRAEIHPFKLLVVDDGSSDQTKKIILSLALINPEIELINSKGTRGHGMACIEGYRMSIARGAAWIFQIDSDGQCDPRYFTAFWRDRSRFPVQFGHRRTRQDGITRKLISRALSVLCLLRCRIWLKDSNVPYRLMRGDILNKALTCFPTSDLANVLLTLRLCRLCTIEWKEISFRKRISGKTSLKLTGLPFRALRLWRELNPENTSVECQRRTVST